MRVVLQNDLDPVLPELMVARLQAAGFEHARPAVAHAAAAELAIALPADALILNVFDKSGGFQAAMDAARTVRAALPRCALIFTTGQEGSEPVLRREIGEDFHLLEMPFPPQALADLLHELAGKAGSAAAGC